MNCSKMTKNKTKKYKSKRLKTPFASTKKNSRVISSDIKPISFEKACSDFKRLQLSGTDTLHSTRIGNNVMDYYFLKARLHTKTKRGVSYYEWLKTQWQKNESEYRMYKFNLAQGKTPEQARYGVFRLYYGSTQGFKPLVAKWLYSLYSPKVAVLDFSAGWGGRCLAAMALGIPYIGIDTNVSLRPIYEKMVRELSSAINDNNKFQVTMAFKDAAKVNYANYGYDMVFTSPPYFKKLRLLEVYPHMPHYASKDDFNARFLFPVIRETFKHLKQGGTFAINISEDAFQDVRRHKPILLPERLHAKHRLFIQPRFAKGNPVNPETQYKEYIYVWKKV
jgi:tRNA1(Val) A37 N6-methylase TrmN6